MAGKFLTVGVIRLSSGKVTVMVDRDRKSMQIPGVVTGHYLFVGDGSNFGHSNKGVLKC